MSFAEAGGQDQNLFQNSLGPAFARAAAWQARLLAGEFNGYLFPAK
jgi:hypothetical protein